MSDHVSSSSPFRPEGKGAPSTAWPNRPSGRRAPRSSPGASMPDRSVRSDRRPGRTAPTACPGRSRASTGPRGPPSSRRLLRRGPRGRSACRRTRGSAPAHTDGRANDHPIVRRRSPRSKPPGRPRERVGGRKWCRGRNWCPGAQLGRVDLGGRPPRPPTEPDVPVKGIRLVTLWRCPSHDPLPCGNTLGGSMPSAWFRRLAHNAAPPSLHGVR